MKTKFWIHYLAFVLLLTGVGYFAIANISDVPLALSESEMASLRGTVGENSKCIRSSERGCANTECQDDPEGQVTYGYRYNDCQWKNGWYCNYWGPHDAQVICRIAFYHPDCSGPIMIQNVVTGIWEPRIEQETASDCNSRLMR